jgi:hypothetical protein
MATTFTADPGNDPNWAPKWAFKTDAPTFDPRFDIGAQLGGWHYGVRAYAGYGGDIGDDGEAKRGPDVVSDYSDFAGVLGTGIHVTGVAGTSVEHIGVYGQSGEAADPEDVGRPIPDTLFRGGVVGASVFNPGVFGWSNWVGVLGQTTFGAAVFGNARYAGGFGVIGLAHDLGPGFDLGTFPGPLMLPGFYTTPGVFGTSDQQAGVVGTSNDLMGVYGYSIANAGVVGQSGSPQSYAGAFLGNVLVTGDTTVSGNLTVGGVISPNPKAAVVPFPDGTQRLLYCMESPEVWFEDFGAAKLKRGRAVVKIDAHFARVIKRGDYRVFVTPEGDCRGLYIRHKRAASFEVRELAGGKSSVAFSYRIVAHRKDIRGYTRFAKVDARLVKTDKRLELPASATRAPGKRAPTARALRAFMASLGMDARARRAKDAMKARRLRALRKRSRA